MNRLHCYWAFALILLCFVIGNVEPQAKEAQVAAILTAGEQSWAENLAAREVRRYIYMRTGRLFPLVSGGTRKSSEQTLVIVARKDQALLADIPEAAAVRALPPQGYLLKTVQRAATANYPAPWRNRSLLLVVGGDDAGTLYAAYRLAEVLGVRFYLHDDVVPDERVPWKLPVVDEISQPLFKLRGIQPFHDFAEGPDWWNRDDYLAIVGQLPKLKMNFLGLHTYPEDRPNAEPTVWIGPESELGEGGRVKASYPSSYQSTVRGNWGYASKKTGDYVFGASELFERDEFGPDVMSGHFPAPSSAEACNEVVNNAGNLLCDAFTFARRLGVKTCVGTETPLVIPREVQGRLNAQGKTPTELATVEGLYEGMFRRAAAAYPLDYYWFWTPEGWTWSGTKDEDVRATTNDLFAAIAAHKKVKPPFALATCGWVLGPQQDRALFDKTLPKDIALSCINREVGKTPVEPGFAEVQGRSKWAIPWMEDDPALTSPQLWVGRMRRDAADSLQYGCDGLLGIHWRTRVLGPNVAALAQATWNQAPWAESYRNASVQSKARRAAGAVGGSEAAFPDNPIADTDDPTLYQTVRYNLSAYRLPATNGTCRVTLKFCEPHYGEAGKRAFDVKLQGKLVIENLDIFARVGKNRALDFTFADVLVTDGWVVVDFVPRIEFPSIAAIDIQGQDFRTAINCGGPAHGAYAADALVTPVTQVYADTSDFYFDWARHEFGGQIAKAAAAIFSTVDCQLPVPSVWTDGPGGIKPDPRPWLQAKQAYAFVDDFAALRSQVKGLGNLERFDYWLSTLEYLRTIGEINCVWNDFNRAMQRAKAEKDSAACKQLALELAVPERRKLVRLTENLYMRLLATVSTTGEMGTVANWEQHNLPILLTKPGEELARVLGQPLAPDLVPLRRYHGPARIIVPTKRTSLALGESLKLKVMILAEEPPRSATLLYREMGNGGFAKTPLKHLARCVYTVELPWSGAADLEYYIRVELERGGQVLFPATAPQLNRTMVVQGR